jgi:hypothetical protein
VRFDQMGLFGLVPDGQPWPANTPWLLASPGFAARAGVAPDAVFDFRLDPLGGAVTLYQTVPSNVVHRFSYGSRGETNAPAPGHSLQHLDTGEMVEATSPDPTNFTSDVGHLACQCPLNWLVVDGRTVATRAAQADTAAGSYGVASAGYSWPTGTFEVGARQAGGFVQATDLFYVSGVTAGTPITIRVRLRLNGQISAPYNDYCSYGWARARLRHGTDHLAEKSWYTIPAYCGSGRTPTGFLDLVLEKAALEVFPLSVEMSAGGCIHAGSGHIRGAMEVFGLPPGAFLRSCNGYPLEVPTSIAPSVVSATGIPGGVKIVWQGRDERGPLPVERRTEDETWVVRAWIKPEVDGTLHFEELDLAPGHRYGYRLRSPLGPVAEVWVTVPQQSAQPLLIASFDRLQSRLTVVFTLAKPKDPRLELLDVAGRLVWSAHLGLREAGPHELSWPVNDGLRSGLYFLRLEAGSRAVTAKLPILR